MTNQEKQTDKRPQLNLRSNSVETPAIGLNQIAYVVDSSWRKKHELCKVLVTSYYLWLDVDGSLFVGALLWTLLWTLIVKRSNQALWLHRSFLESVRRAGG